MSKQETSAKDVRKQLRTISADEFMKAHTLAALVVVAATLSIEIPEGTKTKQDHYDVIIKGAKLPDQTLRGKSSVSAPVAQVWRTADVMVAAQPEGERASRSEVVEECKANGVAHHTARTQFQSWFTATNRGTRRLSDLDVKELPQELHPKTEVAA